MSFYGWKPYVTVAKRRAKAEKALAKMKKKGLNVQPVELSGHKIAASFWGKGWCDHMESFSDYANRLPRGKSYVRNGSVCHLDIQSGRIEAIVSGSELYNISITISPLAKTKWDAVKSACTGQIGSLIDLLRGKLAGGVMEVVANRQTGLFPLPGEIKFDCDCPDWADMCKHVAAVLYGVGARLDHAPEKLFLLRGVNHEELVDVSAAVQNAAGAATSRRRIAATGLGDVFGVEMADAGNAAEPAPRKSTASTTAQKPSARKEKSGLKDAVKKPEKAAKCVKRAVKSTQSAAAPVVIPFPEPLTGTVIRSWRDSLGETQAKFAARISVSAGAISQWEKRGEQTFGLLDSTLAALSKAWQSTHKIS